MQGIPQSIKSTSFDGKVINALEKVNVKATKNYIKA